MALKPAFQAEIEIFGLYCQYLWGFLVGDRAPLYSSLCKDQLKTATFALTCFQDISSRSILSSLVPSAALLTFTCIGCINHWLDCFQFLGVLFFSLCISAKIPADSLSMFVLLVSGGSSFEGFGRGLFTVSSNNWGGWASYEESAGLISLLQLGLEKLIALVCSMLKAIRQAAINFAFSSCEITKEKMFSRSCMWNRCSLHC